MATLDKMGMAGFDSILGIDYFYQVPAELRRNGAIVYVASVSSFNDNDVRGEQLLKQMKEYASQLMRLRELGHADAARRHYRESLDLAVAQLKQLTGGRRRTPL